MSCTLELTYRNGHVNTINMDNECDAASAARAIFTGSSSNLIAARVYDWGEENNRNTLVFQIKR